MKYWLVLFFLLFLKNIAFSQNRPYSWRSQYCMLGDFYLSDSTKQQNFGMIEIDFKENILLFDKKYLEKYTHILIITHQHKYKLKSEDEYRYKSPYKYVHPYPYLGDYRLEIHEKLRKKYTDQMGLSLESPKWLSLSAPDYLPLELFEVNSVGENVPIVGLEGYLIPKTLLLQQEGERTFDASDIMQFSFVFNTQGKKRNIANDYRNKDNDYYQKNDLKITFKKGTHLKVTYKTGKILSFEEKTMKDKQIKLHVKIK